MKCECKVKVKLFMFLLNTSTGRRLFYPNPYLGIQRILKIKPKENLKKDFEYGQKNVSLESKFDQRT